VPAKILAFDPDRRIPPRHYTPIAMRGRLLTMPTKPDTAAKGNSIDAATPSTPDNHIQKCGKSVSSTSNEQDARNESCSLRW
jgi:hypothetical protein